MHCTPDARGDRLGVCGPCGLEESSQKGTFAANETQEQFAKKEEKRKTHASLFFQILPNTSQPALKIAGTLARPTVTGDALVSASVKQTPQQGAADKNVVASAPLLVFEDRGALAPNAAAPHAQADALQPFPGPAASPHRAEQHLPPNGISAPVPSEGAQCAVAPAAPFAGGLPPLSRLHEEVAEFAAAAWPTRVSFFRSIFFHLIFFLLP